MMRFFKIVILAVALIAALAIGSVYGAAYYYTSQHGAGCASCHEMTANAGVFHGSAHRNATCLDCHEATLATSFVTSAFTSPAKFLKRFACAMSMC